MGNINSQWSWYYFVSARHLPKGDILRTQRFIACLYHKGETPRWAFKGPHGKRAVAADFRDLFFEKLQIIQDTTDLIDSQCQVWNDYGIQRSRSGSSLPSVQTSKSHKLISSSSVNGKLIKPQGNIWFNGACYTTIPMFKIWKLCWFIPLRCCNTVRKGACSSVQKWGA